MKVRVDGDGATYGFSESSAGTRGVTGNDGRRNRGESEHAGTRTAAISLASAS